METEAANRVLAMPKPPAPTQPRKRKTLKSNGASMVLTEQTGIDQLEEEAKEAAMKKPRVPATDQKRARKSATAKPTETSSDDSGVPQKRARKSPTEKGVSKENESPAQSTSPLGGTACAPDSPAQAQSRELKRPAVTVMFPERKVEEHPSQVCRKLGDRDALPAYFLRQFSFPPPFI